MADVSRSPGDADRGQLILITGLTIGISIVVLVLLLNTAIYTENLATRTIDGGGTEAIEYQHDVTRDVGGIVDRENRREYGTYADLEASVTDGIEQYDAHVHRQYAQRGIVASINQSTVDTTEGKLVRHTDESRQFTGASGASDWTVASSLPAGSGTRGFVVTVDETGLTTTASPVADDAFYVEVNATPDEWWRVYVYSNGGEVQLHVEDSSGVDEPLDCASGTTASIDLTRGRVDDERCPELDWGGPVDSSYELRFRNGQAAAGTYNVTVSGTSTGDVNADSADGSPYRVPAVYDVSANLVYESPTVTYETEHRVAPGESE